MTQGCLPLETIIALFLQDVKNSGNKYISYIFCIGGNRRPPITFSCWNFSLLELSSKCLNSGRPNK